MRSRLLLLATTLLSFFGEAQKPIPAHYFAFPIKPGKVNYLTGNFGELRPTIFMEESTSKQISGLASLFIVPQRDT